ncbi:MAG: hypothetical protein EBR95_00305 [Verrucomicrobia bacterium]|nr:hypothetical protein [Verrucomicrobiota bacterium]
MTTKTPDGWSSKLGVIMAVAGSAVGLGNFLRFPGLVADKETGGGAFLIAYFISLLIVGLPICWVEWTLGRFGGTQGFNSSPGIFHAIVRKPWGKYVGLLGFIIPVGVYFYYVVIESWCLGYAWNSFSGGLDLGKDPKTYADAFASFTGLKADGAILGLGTPFLFFVGVFVLNFIINHLPRPLQGHRVHLQLGHAAPDRHRPHPARARADARHARSGQTRAQRLERPRLHVEPARHRQGPVESRRLAQGSLADLLHAVRRLRRDHHLRQLPQEERRRRPERPHRHRRQRVLRSRPGRPHHRPRGVRLPRGFRRRRRHLRPGFQRASAGLRRDALRPSLRRAFLHPALHRRHHLLPFDAAAGHRLPGRRTRPGPPRLRRPARPDHRGRVHARRLLQRRPQGALDRRFLDRRHRHLPPRHAAHLHLQFRLRHRTRLDRGPPWRRPAHPADLQVHHPLDLAGLPHRDLPDVRAEERRRLEPLHRRTRLHPDRPHPRPGRRPGTPRQRRRPPDGLLPPALRRLLGADDPPCRQALGRPLTLSPP